MFLSGNDANNVYPKNAVFLFGAIPFFIKYVEFIEPKGPVEYKHWPFMVGRRHFLKKNVFSFAKLSVPHRMMDATNSCNV